MTVQSGLVGSSVVKEFGERSMIEAGKKAQLKTPFWMSEFIGKSASDGTMELAYHTYIDSDDDNDRWTMYNWGTGYIMDSTERDNDIGKFIKPIKFENTTVQSLYAERFQNNGSYTIKLYFHNRVESRSNIMVTLINGSQTASMSLGWYSGGGNRYWSGGSGENDFVKILKMTGTKVDVILKFN